MTTTDIDKKFDENKYQIAKEVWDEYDTYRAEQWKLNRTEIDFERWLDSKLNKQMDKSENNNHLQPKRREIADKINELIEVINSLSSRLEKMEEGKV